MKYLSLILSVLLLVCIFCSCASGENESAQNMPNENTLNEVSSQQKNDETSKTNENTPDNNKKILVAYFSATNNTKGVAEKIADYLNADIYSITPETPYTDADLDYNTDCRANKEQNDDSARPKISGSAENMEQYDVIFIGYPIWWGQAPKIMYTFLESYDFNGKTIIPFCTSGSSPIGSSAENMHSLADGANWLEGRRFSGGASDDEVSEWVSSLELK